MLSTKDIALVYETLLLSPSMNEPVKIALNMPRKNMLLLAKVIHLGLANKEAEGEQTLVSIIAKKDTLTELSALSDELLNKTGLQEMNSKLAAYFNGLNFVILTYSRLHNSRVRCFLLHIAPCI